MQPKYSGDDQTDTEEVKILEQGQDQSADEFSRDKNDQKLMEQIKSCIRESRNKQVKGDLEKLKRTQRSEPHGWQKKKVALQHKHEGALAVQSRDDVTVIKQEIAKMFNLQDELEDHMTTIDLLQRRQSQLQVNLATKVAHRRELDEHKDRLATSEQALALETL